MRTIYLGKSLPVAPDDMVEIVNGFGLLNGRIESLDEERNGYFSLLMIISIHWKHKSLKDMSIIVIQ